MAQSVVQLTCIQEVAGSNPRGEQIFFFEISILLQTRFLEFSFDNIVTSHSKHTLKRSFSVVHSCQNHVDKQWLTSSDVGSISA